MKTVIEVRENGIKLIPELGEILLRSPHQMLVNKIFIHKSIIYKVNNITIFTTRLELIVTYDVSLQIVPTF